MDEVVLQVGSEALNKSYKKKLKSEKRYAACQRSNLSCFVLESG